MGGPVKRVFKPLSINVFFLGGLRGLPPVWSRNTRVFSVVYGWPWEVVGAVGLDKHSDTDDKVSR